MTPCRERQGGGDGRVCGPSGRLSRGRSEGPGTLKDYFLIPDITALGIAEEESSDGLRYLAYHDRWNLSWYSDTWDGYPVVREAFYTLCRDAGAEDLLVLTGDTLVRMTPLGEWALNLQ